jgi:hypothetical protein
VNPQSLKLSPMEVSHFLPQVNDTISLLRVLGNVALAVLCYSISIPIGEQNTDTCPSHFLPHSFQMPQMNIAGPRTPAEEKADSVLSCMEGCGGVVSCQNSCISTGYNIPSGPVPSATASIPPPLGATVTPGVSASTAPAAATTAPGTPPKGQGSGAQSGFGYSMGGAVAFVVFASFFVAL